MRSICSSKWLILVVILAEICFLLFLRSCNLRGMSLWSNKFVFSSNNSKLLNDERFATESGKRSRYALEEQQQEERLRRIQDVCQHYKIDGKVQVLYAYAPHNISYCSNHKVASTYWIRIFRFLHNDTPPGTKRPADISKFFTHNVLLRQTRKRNFVSAKDREEIMRSYRFMMARDPYQRLWSVFIDKFVLLDVYFWTTYFKDIRANFLRGFEGFNEQTSSIKQTKLMDTPFQNFSHIRDRKSHSRYNKPRFRRAKTICKQLSFEEFLIYVVNTGKSRTKPMDDHFQPIHVGCNPCLFKPNFVGKVETLGNEKGFLLERLGLSPEIDEATSFEDFVRQEMTTLSQFQFDLLHTSSYLSLPCITMKTIQERIVVAFVLNGYLSANSLDIISPLVPLPEKKFVEKLIRLFTNSNRTRAIVKQQRESMRIDAYKKIPFQSLLSLQTIYEQDFLLFGYEPRPAYIFDDRLDSDIKKVVG